jgi:hypothetical protein
LNTGKQEADEDSEAEARQSFINLAGEDGEIDAYELQHILNSVFMKGEYILIFCNLP